MSCTCSGAPGRSDPRRPRRSLTVIVVLSAAASFASGCSRAPTSTGVSQAGFGGNAPPVSPGPPDPMPVATSPGVAAGAGASSAPPSSSGAPPPSSPSIRLSAASGLYLLDPPIAGEPLFEGKVEVVIDGKAPPADTVVEMNGVELLRETRNDDADRFWHLDAAAPQPPMGADGTVTITARSGSLTGTIRLPCPLAVGVSSSPPPGTSLSGSPALVLSWADPMPADRAMSAFSNLRALDAATLVPSPDILAHKLLAPGAVAVSLPVDATASTGYVAELRWQGAFQSSGNSDGLCGRAQRLFYPN